MTDTAHTPTPWTTSENAYGCFFIQHGEGRTMSLIAGGNSHDTLSGANAAHIVKCVNEAEAKDKRIAELEAAINGNFCVLFLDGRDEHGAYVLPSFPRSIDLNESDLDGQAESIAHAAEVLGFKVGEDDVWANFIWNEPQIDEFARVEHSGYWEFTGINLTATQALKVALAKAGGS